MPRNDYISDNLVHMRDRLKQNYAEAQATGNPSAPAAAAPVAENIPSAPAPAPAVFRSGRSDELERMRRDLEGRLNRDVAAVAAELECEARRRAELEKFQAKLKEFSGRFAELATAGDAENARSLEHLRIEYFQAYGRVSAFEFGAIVSAGSSGSGEPARKRDWLTPAATVAAAVILSVTLLILFL